VTGYLRNPVGRLLKKAAGIEGAEIEDLPLYEAQELCDLLNQ
jgi:hypothetical protein